MRGLRLAPACSLHAPLLAFRWLALGLVQCLASGLHWSRSSGSLCLLLACRFTFSWRSPWFCFDGVRLLQLLLNVSHLLLDRPVVLPLVEILLFLVEPGVL